MLNEEQKIIITENRRLWGDCKEAVVTEALHTLRTKLIDNAHNEFSHIRLGIQEAIEQIRSVSGPLSDEEIITSALHTLRVELLDSYQNNGTRHSTISTDNLWAELRSQKTMEQNFNNSWKDY
jgi:hypothetical protein